MTSEPKTYDEETILKLKTEAVKLKESLRQCQSENAILHKDNLGLKEELGVGNHLLAAATDKQRELEAENANPKESLQARGQCNTCHTPLPTECITCQRLWES